MCFRELKAAPESVEASRALFAHAYRSGFLNKVVVWASLKRTSCAHTRRFAPKIWANAWTFVRSHFNEISRQIEENESD